MQKMVHGHGYALGNKPVKNTQNNNCIHLIKFRRTQDQIEEMQREGSVLYIFSKELCKSCYPIIIHNSGVKKECRFKTLCRKRPLLID